MKFGGTSNQDAAAMQNVLRLVQDHLAERPVVVISAIARATNELEQAARLAQSGDEAGALTVLGELFNRHEVICNALIKDSGRAQSLSAVFVRYHQELERLVHGLSILGELTPRSMDAVCSYGERLSSRLIAAGLQERGINGLWVDAKEFMITDDAFGNAQPQMDIVKENLERKVRPLLEQGSVPVTQGFIGVTRSGLPTTMGRESSDYTASIIGAAMDAAKVQIWTDVDGILTADPSIVRKPKLVEKMSFKEAFELSFFGAKVLHPGTMLPMLEKGIPVQILNSKNDRSHGTTVDASPENRPACVKSIAYKQGVSVVVVTPWKRVNQYLFWEGVYSVLNRQNVAVGNSSTSEYGIALVVDAKTNVANLERDLAEVGSVELTESLGAVCLVGQGIREQVGLLNRIFSSLGDTPVRFVALGASDSSMILVVDKGVLDKAVCRLHNEFFGG